MNVLFLDIDGVLNRFDIERAGDLRMEPELVQRLKRVVERHDLKIVVSSDWRLDDDWLERVLLFMGRCGWDNPPVIGCTPNFNAWRQDGMCRGHEIEAWLREHPEVSSFVILDDLDDMLPEQSSRVVIVDQDGAFTEKNAEALEALIIE